MLFDLGQILFDLAFPMAPTVGSARRAGIPYFIAFGEKLNKILTKSYKETCNSTTEETEKKRKHGKEICGISEICMNFLIAFCEKSFKIESESCKSLQVFIFLLFE
jgi:hypothetical protein